MGLSWYGKDGGCSSAEPTLVLCLEPGADRAASEGGLPKEPDRPRVSATKPSTSPYIQGGGALKRELSACLRPGRPLRLPREHSRNRGKAFIADALMISDHPAKIGDRGVPGHWEEDLILGLGSSAIDTLVERTICFTMLLHLPRMEGHGK